MSFSQEELDGLLKLARFHFDEFAANFQAAYHCMCERGEGNSIALSLEMAAIIGKALDKLNQIEDLRVLEDE